MRIIRSEKSLLGEAWRFKSPEKLREYRERYGVVAISSTHVQCSCGMVIVARKQIIEKHQQAINHTDGVRNMDAKVKRALSLMMKHGLSFR